MDAIILTRTEFQGTFSNVMFPVPSIDHVPGFPSLNLMTRDTKTARAMMTRIARCQVLPIGVPANQLVEDSCISYPIISSLRAWCLTSDSRLCAQASRPSMARLWPSTCLPGWQPCFSGSGKAEAVQHMIEAAKAKMFLSCIAVWDRKCWV